MKLREVPRPLGAFMAAAAVALLNGCAHYAPLPLPAQPPLARSLATLQGAPESSALTVGQVVALALANNPDLKAQRLKRGAAQAQLQQSGILPNPTLSGAILPLISGAGSVPAWTLGLSQNIRAIVTYRSRQRGARDAAQQVDADVVWQEWQVAGQARQLAAGLILGAQSRPSYLAAYELLANHNAKVEKALAADDITLATAAPDRVALHAARTALNALDQRQLSLTHQLHALLGLAPEVTLPLSATIDLPPIDPAAVRAEISSLPDRRPDLVALRMGYAQADEQVHEAILAQFPDLVLGAVASGDNARVVNGGPNVSVGLPIFDRNQGAVAVAAARREQLHAEYASRLASVVGQVEAMLTEMEQLSGQLENAKRDLPAARLAADRARVAFAAANLDERAYVDLVVNGFTQEQNIMTLELALLDRQIALQTLTGAGLPTVSTSSDKTMSTQR